MNNFISHLQGFYWDVQIDFPWLFSKFILLLCSKSWLQTYFKFSSTSGYRIKKLLAKSFYGTYIIKFEDFRNLRRCQTHASDEKISHMSHNNDLVLLKGFLLIRKLNIFLLKGLRENLCQYFVVSWWVLFYHCFLN